MKGFVSRRKPALKAVQAKRASMALRRRDAHERQADDVANRFVTGQTELSRFLTPAPAAGFTLPSSPGEPLAAGIRTELEHAFGVDLSAVRIHRDEAAATIASRLNARAFTSGTHIYFAEREFSPVSPDGRELLAHETAHAIQQASVRDSRGKVSTYGVTGAGAVQLSDDEEKSPLEEIKAIPTDLDFYKLAQVHRAAYPNNKLLRELFSLFDGSMKTFNFQFQGARRSVLGRQ